MRFPIALLAAVAVLAPAHAETLETWPSLRSAAGHLGGLLIRDLRDWPHLGEPVCVVQAAAATGDADTRAAAAAVAAALERLGFHTISPTEGQRAAALPVVHVETSRLPSCRILRVRLDSRQYQAMHVNKDWVDDAAQPGWITVCSDARWTRQEARAEANGRLLDQLVTDARAQARSGLADDYLRRHVARLLARPDIRRDEFTATIVKPYGVRYRWHERVRIPAECLQGFVDDLIREQHSRWQQRGGGTALTLAGWLVGLWVLIRVDRWTRGYRRPILVTSALLILCMGTSCLWVLVCQW